MSVAYLYNKIHWNIREKLCLFKREYEKLITMLNVSHKYMNLIGTRSNVLKGLSGFTVFDHVNNEVYLQVI